MYGGLGSGRRLHRLRAEEHARAMEAGQQMEDNTNKAGLLPFQAARIEEERRQKEAAENKRPFFAFAFDLEVVDAMYGDGPLSSIFDSCESTPAFSEHPAAIIGIDLG